MKSFRISLTLLTLAVMAGCSQGTPGGPGATNPPADNSTTVQRPDYGQAEETFKLTVPTLSTQMKQGETKTASIGISRGKNFDQDVTLKFEELPAGVTITPDTTMIMHSQTEASITLQAADDAALGDFTIKVIGHPKTGVDATSQFKLTVDKK